ncbi:helix-turn-helix domain-containing protein [Carnobacterium mobile]|uniref:helix-turn-helix domain-containing protein n=1 Tax=Carnobacterium mobile TaxID=2750 RepID=UPI000A034AC4
MKNENALSCNFNPLFVICSAINGYIEAVNLILKRYALYINKLSLRIICDMRKEFYIKL